MDRESLSQFYDALKGVNSNPVSPIATAPAPNVVRVTSPNSTGALAWRAHANKECERLKDACCKHMLVDMYCKIIPLDKNYVDGCHGQMKADVDAMLNRKGMSATQYLTSCYEATKAPLLEYIQRACNTIGNQFMEDANETLKDAEANDMEVPVPEAPTEDDDIDNQLIDVKQDPEYEDFIDKLKEKTINKIVADITKLIKGKEEENELAFDPKPQQPLIDQEAATESAVSLSMDYIQKKLMKENVELNDSAQDEMLGLAIREATLLQLDRVFNQRDAEFREYAGRIRAGKGYLITESAVNKLSEKFAIIKE